MAESAALNLGLILLLPIVLVAQAAYDSAVLSVLAFALAMLAFVLRWAVDVGRWAQRALSS